MNTVRLLGAQEARERIPELAAVLVDCVAGGASVSFMDGFSMAEGVGFFAGVADAVEAGEVSCSPHTTANGSWAPSSSSPPTSPTSRIAATSPRCWCIGAPGAPATANG